MPNIKGSKLPGRSARQAAIARLIDFDGPEWREVFNEERVKRGLKPVGVKRKTRAELEAEIEELQRKLETRTERTEPALLDAPMKPRTAADIRTQTRPQKAERHDAAMRSLDR